MRYNRAGCLSILSLAVLLSWPVCATAAENSCNQRRVNRLQRKLQRTTKRLDTLETRKNTLEAKCPDSAAVRLKAGRRRCRRQLTRVNRTIQRKTRRSEALSQQVADCGGNPSPSPSASPSPTAPPAAGGLIVDHNAVLDFDNIPEYWLERAKELTIHYAHTSHGSQINSGLSYLERQVDAARYSFARRASDSQAGLPLPESPPALRMFDGNPPTTYVTPEDYWSEQAGQNSTRTVVGSGVYNYSMWAWCGQQSYNTASTVQEYLNTLDQFESEFPGTRFIYMTGHTDGGSRQLGRNNQLVRDYAATNGKILFDFADIESYDPDGNHYPNTSDDCSWCRRWCNSHPEQCRQLPSCAHSHGFNCIIKGKAFWWMMARLAGWES